MKHVISTVLFANALSAHAMTLRAEVHAVPESPEAAGGLADSLANFVPVPSSRAGSNVEDVQACTKEFDDKCGEKMEQVKDAVMDMDPARVVRSAMGLVECVGDNAEDLWKHCRPMTSKKVLLPSPAKWTVAKEAVTPFSLAAPLQQDRTKCREEWREECGDEADKFRTAVQNGDIAGVVMAAMEVVKCAHKNMDDLRKKCSPFEQEDASKPVVTAVFAPSKEDVDALVAARERQEQPIVVVETTAVTGVRECTKEFDDKCGKNLEQLKDAVLSLDFMRLLHASLGIVACGAENGKDIWEHCKPGKGEENKVVVIPTLEQAELQKRALEPLLPHSHHHHGGPGGMMKRAFSKISSFVHHHRPGHHDGEEASTGSSSASVSTMEMHAPPPPLDDIIEPDSAMATAPRMPVLSEKPIAMEESKCKKKWEEDCGDKVKELEKSVKEGDAMGILMGAFQVVQCATEHVEDLKSNCKPFHHGRGSMPGQFAGTASSFHEGWHHMAPRQSSSPPEMLMVVQRQSGNCYQAVMAVCGDQVSALQSSPSVTSAQLDALENCLLESLPKIETLCAQQQQQFQSEPGWSMHHGGGGGGCLRKAMHKHARVLHGLFAFFFSLFLAALITRFVKRAYRCHQGETSSCPLQGGEGGCCRGESAAVKKVAPSDNREASYVPLIEKSETGPNAV